MNKKILLAIVLLLTAGYLSASAATYYVSPSGSDSNSGSISSPFASITKAHSVVASGDIVYLRGGTYTNFTIAGSDANYNYVIKITKSGVSYLAHSGETPVFNFSSIGTSLRVCAFQVSGSNNTFQGFEVTGVQVGSQKQSECFQITGNSNKFKLLKIHDCAGIGIYIIRHGADNVVENCDAYNLIGVSGTSAGNIDGFGSHSTGNTTFTGCRAWNCSDDGYDCIASAGAVTFDHCWAYKNGVNGGDGNGFKVGGWGSSTPPSTVPTHTVRFCLSASNKAHGFYANHQPGKAANWYNNTSYNHSAGDFNMLERVSPTDATDIAGTREVLHNNLAYVGTLVKNLNESGTPVSNNSWTLSVTVNSADFQSLDANQITRARTSGGGLPSITFMHLVSGSDLIDKGINVGLSYSGSAPDLGCFEYGSSARIGGELSPPVTDDPADEEATDVIIHPNPSHGSFTIKTDGHFNYTFYNVNGAVTKNGSAEGSATVGQDLQSGMYVVYVRTFKGSRRIKIVKN